MFIVFTALTSCFDPRERHPVKTADAEWCQPVFVLNLPSSCSTRERADGQAATRPRSGLPPPEPKEADSMVERRTSMRPRAPAGFTHPTGDRVVFRDGGVGDDAD